MKYILFTMFLLATASASALELKSGVVIGVPNKKRKEAWQGHVNFVEWLDSNTVIYGGESGFAKCYNLSKNMEVWNRKFTNNIDPIVAGNGKVFVLDEHNSIHVLDASTGKTIKTLPQNTLETLSGDRILPNNIAWVPVRNILLIAVFSKNYGENILLLDGQSFNVVGRAKSDGFLHEIDPTKNGASIVTVSNKNNIRIWSIAGKSEVFMLGDDEEVAFDVPFISHAMSDGKSLLIYSIDNSWATGQISVVDTKTMKESALFDSRNGHLEMDVDFKTSRIALTGTSKNLTLVDFDGQVLADRKNVAEQRIVAVKFSPDGSRLAIGSWDNTLRIFDIKDDGSKKPSISN